MGGGGSGGSTASMGNGGGVPGIALNLLMQNAAGQKSEQDTTSGFGEGLPIIGQLLNGDSKNPGAGSTAPPQPMSIMDQPGASMFASILGPGTRTWGG